MFAREGRSLRSHPWCGFLVLAFSDAEFCHPSRHTIFACGSTNTSAAEEAFHAGVIARPTLARERAGSVRDGTGEDKKQLVLPTNSLVKRLHEKRSRRIKRFFYLAPSFNTSLRLAGLGWRKGYIIHTVRKLECVMST